MGFNPDLKARQGDEGAAAMAEGLTFLKPEEPASPTRWADPAKQEKAELDARKKTLRTLNALRVVGPLLVVVMERAGAGSSDEEAANIFKKLVAEASAFSEETCRRLGVDPEDSQNFWIRNMLERSFCEVLKEQGLKGKRLDLSPLRGPIDALTQMDLGWADAEREIESFSVDIAARAAVIRAASPVLQRAQLGFDFFRNMEKDIEPIMKKLMASASKATLGLADTAATEKERAGLFSILMSEAGNLYSTAWWVEGKKAVEDLSKLSDGELKGLLKQNPEGLPLDRVNEQFEKNFQRLVHVAAKLVPMRAGRMETRIKGGAGKSES